MDARFDIIRKNYNGKILYTRKRVFSFVKLYIIRKYHIELDVTKLKEVAYGEVNPIKDYEIEASYIFSLCMNLFKDKDLSCFYERTGLCGIILNENHLAYSIYDLYNLKIDSLYIFILLNYLLICNNLPIINPYKNRFDEFIKMLNKQEEDYFYNLLIDVIINTEVLDFDYYNKCLEINKELILDFIVDNKEQIIKNGKIEHIYLFGSYALAKTRYDSDIDLLVLIKDDQTYEEKLKGVYFIKFLISDRFKRIVDIHETTTELLIEENNRLRNRILIF